MRPSSFGKDSARDSFPEKTKGAKRTSRFSDVPYTDGAGNWGEITVLNSEEKIKSAVVDLAAEPFQIEIKGNPEFSNATTG